MRYRAVVAVVVATLMVCMPFLTPTAAAQGVEPRPPAAQECILPVAAGAFAGTTTALFILPWIVPATVAAANVGMPFIVGPALAIVGAGVGCLLGYDFLR